MTHKYFIFFLLLVACKQETDSELVASWTNLSTEHNINGLLSYDYDKTDKVFVLGYADGFLGHYEVRDENFNIIKTVNLNFPPYSILYTSDSIYASYDGGYFSTSNGMIMVPKTNGIVTLFDPNTKESKLLYTDPRAVSSVYMSFNSLVETEQYYILALNTATTCIFINKATYEVTNFSDSFKENNAVGGRSVVKTKQDDIILSIALSGMVVDGYLIYKNGTWEPFQPTTLPTTARKMGFVDSRNYAWINGADNEYFKLYDLSNSRFLNTTPAVLSGNFFGYTLREHSNGDIFLKSGTLASTSYQLIQIHFN